MKSSAFQVPASGGTVSGKNLRLAVRAGYLTANFTSRTSRIHAVNIVTGQANTTKPTKIIPKVKVKLLKSGKLRITVKAKGIARPTGKITGKFGKIIKTDKLKAKAKGRLTVTIPAKVKAGGIKVKVAYQGNTKIAKQAAGSIKMTVK